MESKYKIVDFNFCTWCKHEKEKEEDEPCAECLNEPVNVDSHRPVKFEPNEDFKKLEEAMK